MSNRKKQKTDSSVLLAKYENLRTSLRDQNSEAYKGEATELVLKHLSDLKDVYGIVQHENNRDTRVQLMDSEILLDAARFAAINAQNIKLVDLGVSLNVDSYLHQVKKYMDQDKGEVDDDDDDDDEQQQGDSEVLFNSFNWLKMGSLYLQVSSKPIVSDFLYGPLETERKKINVRARILDDTQKGGVVTTATNVQAQDIESNEEQNTAHMVKSVYSKFIEKDDEEEDEEDGEGEGVNFFKFFINPTSFGQSVENLFFTSFLVKDGKLKLTVNKEGSPSSKGPPKMTTMMKMKKMKMLDSVQIIS